MRDAPMRRLGDLCDARGITYGIVKVGEFVPDGVPVIRGGDIRDGRIVFEEEKRVSSAVSEQFRRTILRGGELVINLIAEPGHVALAPPEMAGYNVSRDVAVIPLGNNVNHHFVLHYMRSPSAISWLQSRLQGSVTQKINLGELRELPIPIPSIKVQRAIADVLGALDQKIELNRRLNETLEAMARAIFQDWFVDFGPVRRKVEGATDPVAVMGGLASDPHLAAELAALFPGEFSGEGLPKGWRDRAIGELVEAVGGSTPSTGDSKFWEPAEHRWATPKDLSNLADLALFETGRRISSEGLAKIGSGLLPVGTVLLSSRAPIGYLAIAQVPVAINQGFIALTPTANFGSAYLYLWCGAHIEAILANANGSTFQEISKRNFRPITSAVPSVPEVLRAFNRIVDPLIAKLVNAAAENRTLAEIRDFLLPRLMSGEVRVREAEQTVTLALAKAS